MRRASSGRATDDATRTKGHCFDCLSEMYGEPVKAVSGYLHELRISGRGARCTNCDEDRETFRSDLPS